MLSRFRVPFVAGIVTSAALVAGVATAHLGFLHAASNALPGDSKVAATQVAHAAINTRFAPNYATDLLNLRRWQKNDLVIYIAAPSAEENSDNKDYATAMRQGAALWNPYISDVLSVRFTDNPGQADIRVSFVDHNTLPDGAIGRTEVTYRNRDNVIVSATVRIDRTLKPALLAQVAAHEFGHAFGMEGHSIDRTDLMYARAHLPAAITQRDTNTLHLNYSLEAPRADAHPAAQIGTPTVAKNDVDVTTAAACSLPSEDVRHAH